MNTSRALIRFETGDDAAGIAAVLHAAFGGDAEAWLIDRLRTDGLVEIALAAELEGEIVGHVVLSRIEAEIARRPLSALALAPVAAAPRHQRVGVGSMLIEAGLAEARRRGFDIVFVLGHPAYYPRFGFDAALAARFAAPYRGPAFMALALSDASETGESGTVHYPAAFGP